MACLYRRGKHFWVSYRINGKLVQRSLNTSDKRTAKEKLCQVEYELSRGELQQVTLSWWQAVLKSLLQP
jgi:hypothetical protein